MTEPESMQSARALVAALQRAAAYPHAVVEPVGVTETHISWVLLTGEFAYKVKKPVRLSFLDYSTLERRRFACEEEWRLNRRLAPDLYLGVSVVAGSNGAPRVDGAGPPLEYAVRMRQFAPSEELAALLAHGAVGADELGALGATIAAFHAAAAPARHDTQHGRPATVHRVTMDNFAELRSLPESTGWLDALAALESRIRALYDDLHPRMARRRAAGDVRECHGDLHCGNVVRWGGALIPFDGIEFDPALRYIDIVNDVAFLTMDLAERGHAGLRRCVLQAWAEALGDWDGLPLLPYYESYRALVRAKVHALRAQQFVPQSAERHAAVSDCRRYLDWATARVAERRPALLITCGLSGSGKTWLARQLAPALGALHVRSDVERKRLAGLGPLDDSRSPPDAGIYTLEFNARTYDRLVECAGAALAGGEPVIVDAAFLRTAERLRFLRLAEDRGLPFSIVHCRAPRTVLRERLAARSAARDDASEAGLAVLDRQPSYWEPFGRAEHAHVVEVETDDPAAVSAAGARLAAIAGR